MFTLEQAKAWVPHQEYDNHAAFVQVHNALVPFGFIDTTWHNDECPSVAIVDEVTGDCSLRVWVDYKDPSARGLDGVLQFCVILGDDHLVYDGNDIDAAINAALKAKG
jgi:hypothetical protein